MITVGWYDELTGKFSNSSWWISGNCLTTIVEYALKTQNTSFGSLIENMYFKNGFLYTYTEGYPCTTNHLIVCLRYATLRCAVRSVRSAVRSVRCAVRSVRCAVRSVVLCGAQ